MNLFIMKLFIMSLFMQSTDSSGQRATTDSTAIIAEGDKV